VKIGLRLPSPLPRYSRIQVAQLHGIAGESIANAIKHGRATALWITVRNRGKNHLLEIRDNGGGFPARTAPHGIGLHLMRHRAALLGAIMTIENCQPTGARVRVNYSVA
jgi:signal transduction histidine kinase